MLETSKFSELSLEQLVEKLAESDDLEEQTDILHYLVLCFGLKQKITVPNVSYVHIHIHMCIVPENMKIKLFVTLSTLSKYSKSIKA